MFVLNLEKKLFIILKNNYIYSKSSWNILWGLNDHILPKGFKSWNMLQNYFASRLKIQNSQNISKKNKNILTISKFFRPFEKLCVSHHPKVISHESQQKVKFALGNQNIKIYPDFTCVVCGDQNLTPATIGHYSR